MTTQQPLSRIHLKTDPSSAEFPDRQARITQARMLATKVYPGPLGLWAARELEAFADLAKIIGDSDALVWKVVDDIIEKGKAHGAAQG